MRRARVSATSAAPTSSPMPCTTFSTPGGQPGLVREVGEQRARQRRPLGGLEDDGAARRERRRRLPRREHERRVPRCDHDGRAGRHADHLVRRPVRRPPALLVALGQLGIAAVVAGAAQDHPGTQRALQHRHVDALDASEALDVALDQVGEPSQVRRAARRAERGPRGERVAGSIEGERRLARSPACDLSERRPVDRRVVGEALGRRDALSADVVVGRDVDAGDACASRCMHDRHRYASGSRRSRSVARSSTV